MKIHVLGIYGPFPAGNGATSGYLAEEAGTLVQFDLGSGILSRLTARTAPEKLSAVFLSHWHFDHASDISLLMYRLQSVEAVLPVYAPKDENSLLYRMVAEKECFRLSEIRLLLPRSAADESSYIFQDSSSFTSFSPPLP